MTSDINQGDHSATSIPVLYTKKDKFVLVISEHLPIIKDQLKFVSYKTMPSKELMNGLQDTSR